MKSALYGCGFGQIGPMCVEGVAALLRNRGWGIVGAGRVLRQEGLFLCRRHSECGH